jgi:hypothetical protein
MILTAMTDKRAAASEVKAFRGIKFSDLYVAYRQFCKNEQIEKSAFDAREVIEFFNNAAADLPTTPSLRHAPAQHNLRVRRPRRQLRPTVRAGQSAGLGFAHGHSADVRAAFIAAEDKRFNTRVSMNVA